MADQQTAPLGPYVEVECPHCISDFDLEGPVLPMDHRWVCPSCGTESRLGDIGCYTIPAAQRDGWEYHYTWDVPNA